MTFWDIIHAVLIIGLVTGVILYFLLKSHRKTIGTVMITLLVAVLVYDSLMVNFLVFPMYSVPLIVLVAGIILYFLLRAHRKTLGIVLITFGIVDLAYCSFVVYAIVTPYPIDPGYAIYPPLTMNAILRFMTYYVVRVMPLLLGIISYKKRLKVE